MNNDTTHSRYDAESSLGKLLRENERRNRERKTQRYDPVVSAQSEGHRVKVGKSAYNDGEAWIPAAMKTDRAYAAVASREDWVKLRCRYDFEYWAFMCVTIRDKNSGDIVPFRLNSPQRRLLKIMEEDRLAGRPVRIILLKARQWGGSTLVQYYMAWIQTCLKRNWNSLICGHVKDAAANIRAMYSRLLGGYPERYWDGDAAPGFKSLERSANIRVIEGRGCRVTVGSSESQDAVRGSDYQMAHLSEVAFWRDTPMCNPDDFIRAICGAINNTPMTLVVLESTANGVGNYFHREWQRSVSGQSDKRSVFVPWYEIDFYRREVDDVSRLYSEMDEYEHELWRSGLTLEQIAWFHYKRREYQSLKQMQAEYPSSDTEAFYDVDQNVFEADWLERLRHSCTRPRFTGDIVGRRIVGAHSLDDLELVERPGGCLKIWSMPAEGACDSRYVTAVDIGGRSPSSDYSVISVIDRAGGPTADMPEVAAQWRGHLDHDLIAWKSAQIARLYGNALLVFESNTLETEAADTSVSLLATVGRHYSNIYRRPVSGLDGRLRRQAEGFHTNRATKTMIIDRLIALVRDCGYVERDTEAVDEMATYRFGVRGSFGAMAGYHDDILMTRAIALYVASTMRPPKRDTTELAEYLAESCRGRGYRPAGKWQ